MCVREREYSLGRTTKPVTGLPDDVTGLIPWSIPEPTGARKDVLGRAIDVPGLL